MYKSWLVLFTFIAISSLIVSCSSEYEWNSNSNSIIGPESAMAEWTVMYYGAGNFAEDQSNGESQTIGILQSLENIVQSPRVHTLALIGCNETDGHCLLYDVQPSPDKNESGIQSRLLSDWGSRDMSSPDLIKQYADTVAHRFPARKYLLIVSGDGRGWLGSCSDEINGGSSVMPVTDMRDRLASVTDENSNPLHVDLLYWMAPTMGMLEVAYEMQGLVKFMVSSATKSRYEHYKVMDYWLRDLHNSPESDPEEMGHLILRSVRESGELQYMQVEISLLDLDNATEVARQLDDVSTLLANAVGEYGEQLRAIRDATWSADLDDTLFVDIEALLSAIEADEDLSRIDGLADAINRVRSAMDRLLVERLDTRQLDSRYGITIHFPPFAQQLNLEEYSHLRMTTMYPHWSDFISQVAPEYIEPVTLSGVIRYNLGLRVINPGVFLQPRVGNWDNLITEAKAQFTYLNERGDSASFTVQLPLTSTPLPLTKFGVFMDPDSNGFDAGDDFGIGTFGNGASWITIEAGMEYDSVSCSVNGTRQ